MIEAELRETLINRIPEFSDKMYPTNAPETAVKPYLVYMRINTTKDKTLDGLTGSEHLSFMYNIMATKYADMKSLTKKVEDFLIALPGTQIGTYFVEDIDINNIDETWEPELKVNRGIIDFTIYY